MRVRSHGLAPSLVIARSPELAEGSKGDEAISVLATDLHGSDGFGF
jgi:hypothetical protein